MAQSLFQTEPRRRWTGTRALVLMTMCPDCDTPYASFTATQLPLFYGGGYGEATALTVRYCGCPLTALIRRQAVNPRSNR